MGPDLLYTESTDELVRQSTPLHQNPARRGGRPRKLRRLEQFEYAPYAGWERVLMRTAVVRSSDWREGDVGPRIHTGEQIVPLCRHLGRLDHERIVVFALDAKQRVIAIHEASVGGLHGAAAMPADIGRVPVLLDAKGVIMVHNHPSGDPSPSPDDIHMTINIAGMFEIVGIFFQDHVIVAGRLFGAPSGPEYYSMADAGIGPWGPRLTG